MVFKHGNNANPNGSRKAKIWTAAIERALARNQSGKLDFQAIDACADALVLAARGGDIAALREIGDRVEGKAIQAVEVTKVDPFDELSTNDLLELGRAVGARLEGPVVEAEEGSGTKKAGALPAIH